MESSVVQMAGSGNVGDDNGQLSLDAYNVPSSIVSILYVSPC